MKITPVAAFKGNLPHYLKIAGHEPVFITRNGRIAAVVEAITDDEIEDYLLERSSKFRSMLKKSAKKRGGMPLESYRRSRGV
ncbi:MAG: type II toxin-antitoxin system Phd/YefM family antitoxin [Deltaproteobacteria bacterium]|nr:type II toxin-antitoxin system Phd/YefM family antitoxin [Deltaproteobacteria bacterium]